MNEYIIITFKEYCSLVLQNKTIFNICGKTTFFRKTSILICFSIKQFKSGTQAFQ